MMLESTVCIGSPCIPCAGPHRTTTLSAAERATSWQRVVRKLGAMVGAGPSFRIVGGDGSFMPQRDGLYSWKV